MDCRSQFPDAGEYNAAMAADASHADQRTPNGPPRRGRRFQFSLRSLLVFIVVAAIVSGWLGQKIEQKNKERDATAAILRLGGTVTFDYQSEPNGKPRGPAWLRNLIGEHFFRDISKVTLRGSKIGDAELEYVKIMPALEWLDLGESRITDAGLAQLTGLTTLKLLELGSTKITDSGLDQLTNLVNLESVGLTDDNITDSGAAKLKRLTRLQRLSLDGTSVTFAGEIDVQRALPECMITR